ncbi:MAG TPA: patatin-like phospholipase family protein [Rubrobacteraceae bacterium]|nr:patatin-like phospholipase family protein [Rubrobacteraceae bacterium]
MEETGTRRVAIACQGGGSHTAFTAGVLKKLLTEKRDRHEVVALSGASGGAICALLSWYALLTDGAGRAVELLDSFWAENSANSYWDMVLNDLFVESSRLQGTVALPEISPYLYPSMAQNRLRAMLEDHVEFERLADLAKPGSPELLVSAVDVLSGEFKVFRDAEVSVEAILASAAIPNLFRAVRIGDGVYWDGLFSQNPPVREFVADRPVGKKPDEIWVIQINPERREQEPTSVVDIMDRRNELSGNLSLNQEIRFVGKINNLLDHLPGDHYKRITVRRIEMLRPLDAASKLDRRPSFIQEMMAYGEEQAEDFLRELPDQDSNLD